jgi:ketosteroid isomerase-like protein
MNRILLVALTLLLASSFGAAQESRNSATSSKSHTSSVADKDLQKRSQEYADALAKKDVAALDKIWADDYTFINPQGELVTKAQRLANLKSGSTEFQSVTPRQEQLHLHGNVAVDIGRVELRGTKYSGQESSGEYRYTNVWVRTGGSWQILSNQITLMKK